MMAEMLKSRGYEVITARDGVEALDIYRQEWGRIDLVVSRLVGRLEVTVEDDGRGLPPGFDLDASTHLGLSIVRRLVPVFTSEMDTSTCWPE